MNNEEMFPVWKDVPAEQLKQNSVKFVCPRNIKILDVAEAIAASGYDDLLSVQISANSRCIVTFLSNESAMAMADHGIELDGTAILVHFFTEPLVEIRVLDAPIWVSDQDLIFCLAGYGTCAGTQGVRHGHIVTKSGLRVATGIRHLTFKLNKGTHIPSVIKTQGGLTVRVRYDGQVRTCNVCNNPDHLAAQCPNKGINARAPPRTGRAPPPPAGEACSQGPSGSTEVVETSTTCTPPPAGEACSQGPSASTEVVVAVPPPNTYSQALQSPTARAPPASTEVPPPNTYSQALQSPTARAPPASTEVVAAAVPHTSLTPAKPAASPAANTVACTPVTPTTALATSRGKPHTHHQTLKTMALLQ